MNQTRYLSVRLLLWLIAAYHLVAGVAATFFKDAAVQVGSLLFGVGITMDGQTELLVRYLGAFGITLAVLAALAALDPVKNRAIIVGAVVYFLARAFDRVMFAALLEQHRAGPVPNWFRIVVILAFAVALLWLMPRRPAASVPPGA